MPVSRKVGVDKETKAAFGEIAKALNALRSDMESGVESMQSDIKSMQSDMESMRADMATKADLAELRRNIRKDVKVDMREAPRDVRAAVKRLEGHTGLEAR